MRDKTKETLILILKYIGYALAIMGFILATLLSALTKKKTKISTPRPPKHREYPYQAKARRRKMYYSKKYGGSRYK